MAIKADNRPFLGKPPNPPNDKSGIWGNRLWALGSIENFANKIAPSAYNGIEVIIVGRPEANLNNLYKTALSIASGVQFFKANQDKPKSGYTLNSTKFIEAYFDYINKTVKVLIGYEQGGFYQALPTNAPESLDGADMLARPIQDPIPFYNYPDFLQPAFKKIYGDVGPADVPGASGNAIQSAPSGTPGLSASTNGTYGSNPGIMSPAILAGKCEVPPAAPPQPSKLPPREVLPPTGDPLVTPVNLAVTLRRLFDGPPGG